MHEQHTGDDLRALAGFRRDFYACLTRRADALFELTDALLCADGPVTSMVGLSLAAVHRRGHGALYDAVNAGRITIGRLRRELATLRLPRDRQGRIMLAVDVSPWLRPDAATARDRAFCHVHGRARNAGQVIPGWPYSLVVALEAGRSSWCAILDALRLGPDEDATTATATQLRQLIERLRAGGQHHDGDPPILICLDAGYDITRLAFLLADLPVILVGRVRTDRVFHRAPPPPPAGHHGRPARHGEPVDLDQPHTHPPATVSTQADTSRYGRAVVDAFTDVHQQLQRRGGWAEHTGQLPIVAGTLVRLRVDRLPGDRRPAPLWLWVSAVHPTPEQVDRWWHTYLRRFDIEHLFRFVKQVLGWTRPRLRDPHAADRWTWLIIACHTQLRLARDLSIDLRRPWERPITTPGRLTPTRVRRGFVHLHAKLPHPASAPKPTRPGPGRPPGSKNKHLAPRPPVGKTPQPNPTGNSKPSKKV